MVKTSQITILSIMIICFIGLASAASNFGTDGHMKQATAINSAGHIPRDGVSTGDVTIFNTNAMKTTSLRTINGAALPTAGTCIDNTKKIAVYMPTLNTTVTTESGGVVGTTQTTATYDPYCTSMFFEYDTDYLSDSTIISALTKNNYDLLIVPMCEMSDDATDAINAYLDSGGSVWFINDPSLDESENIAQDRIAILGGTTYSDYNFISGESNITTVTTDELTSGLPAQFTPIGTEDKWSFFRSQAGSGTINGFNYNVLMNNGDCSMFIKYENPSTGARAIYSNPNMFISGGTASYFNAQQSSQFFLKTKAWLLKMADNTGTVQVTYPNGDKQFTITIDDSEGAPWETPASFFSMETAHGITPANINTFFIIPDANTNLAGLTPYANNGDIHTLHCHNIADWTNSQDVSTYDSDIAQAKSIINTATGSSDFGFTSWRFPYTSYCLNAQKAVADSGFMIDSTNGRYTDGAMIGSHTDNNLMFPKQMLIDDAKTNVVEMEMTSCFDLCASSPAEYYQISTDEIPSLRGVNFPSDYVLGGHYQCDVTVPTMIDTVGQILDASKDAGTSYSTLNTLSKYMTAVKSATITANVNGGTTTITVVNDKSITDFTLKAASGSIASAKCDGATLTVTKDTATGSAYITKTIAAGTHTFIINTTEQVSVVPTASFDSNITNGMTPLTVQFNSTLTNVKSVSWKFGDGSATVKTNNATHTFVNTRKNTVNYIVTLTATGNNGAKVTATKTITIQPVPVKPVPAFTISAKSGNTNTIFKFTDKSTSIPTTWSWDFGDGAASTDKIAMHQYATAGTYTVTLIVGNNAGSVQLSKTVTVVGIPPKAAFVYSPTPVKKGVVTTFTDTSTQNPSQWLWAFSDDGSTATTATTTHTFTKTGSATVTLTVTNNAGSKTVTKQINVR